MKIFKYGANSLVLFRIFNVIWYIEWIVAITFLVMLGVAGHMRGGYALQLPITFEEHTAARLAPINGNTESGILNTTAAILVYHVDANLQNIIMIIFGYGSVFTVVVLITGQLRLMSKDFNLNAPFQKLSIFRIKYIAFVLIGYSFIQWLFVAVVNHFTYQNFKIKNLALTYDFNFSCLIIGVILLIVVEIFKVGIELEEERKLIV
jgi:hypothetical protein